MFLKMPVALLAFVMLLPGCVQEGSVPECGEGGASALAEDGCATPVGGSCLSEADFKKGRPSTREDGEHTVTIADDWISYQEQRPNCEFECMTEEEFRKGRSDQRRSRSPGSSSSQWISLDADFDAYMNDRRPDCF